MNVETLVNSEIYCRANSLVESYLTSNPDHWDDIINLYDEDGPKEILQYILVSRWLFDKLTDIGEPVLQIGDCYVWCRTTCGQSISMDSCINEIYSTLVKRV